MLRLSENSTYTRKRNPRKLRSFDSAMMARLVDGHGTSQSHYITMDGLDDYGTFKASEMISATADYTVEFWVNLHSTTDHQRVLCQDGDIFAPWSITIVDQQFVLFDGAAHERKVIGAGVNLDYWNHVAFTKNGTSYKVYLFSKEAIVINNTPTAGDSTENNFCCRHSTSNFANADFWQFRIWNYPLTQVELTKVQTMIVNDAHPGLLAYWPMDEGTGSTLNDVTGNGWDITLIGGTWV